MDVGWTIQLLGGLRAERGDRIVTRFRSQKSASLLAYLAYYGQRTHPRQVLIELLWPESNVRLARHNLSNELSWLRHQLELPGDTAGTILIADRFAVGLNSTRITTDVEAFEAALRSAQAAVSPEEHTRFLKEAVDLYRGPLLPGYYESWILPEQQRLDEQFFHALHSLITHLEQGGQVEAALQHARRGISVDPLREETHHELIRLLVAAGQPGAALRQYHDLERALRQLGASPSAATRALVETKNHTDTENTERARSEPSGRSISPNRQERVEKDRPPDAAHPHQVIRSGTREAGDGHQVITRIEPVGGAVPLGSPFYVERGTDERFAAALARQDSIVLVKGPQQVGKTSLLARGLDQARQRGARVVFTNLEMLNAAHLETPEALVLAFAQSIADELDLQTSPTDIWDSRRGPNPNFHRYMRRQVLDVLTTPLVWGLDEVDRLFHCAFSGEIFGLFRAWHNERALDPGSPWSRLTLAMAYATEAHLFITDLNKSPFNVGTRLELDDFTIEQVEDLNRRYGSPLSDRTEITRYYRLVGGHPYLVRLGFNEMALNRPGIVTFEARSESDDWIFGDYLQRLLGFLARDAELCEVMRGVLAGRPCPTPMSFYRLRSAGLITGRSEEEARPRCQLYAAYLKRHLG